MSRNIFVKTIACFASVPMMMGAIATIQKPANALSSSLLTQQATQTLELSDSESSSELISRYAVYDFRLTNGEGTSMHYFYASPSNVNSWEEDLLGSSTLSPNESIQVYIDDNRASCYYDFKAIFSDGSSSTHYGIDVCELRSYTF